MNYNAFRQIRQFIHFTDSSKVLDKGHPWWTPLQKVTPVIDILLGWLQEAWNLGIAICVDESMIRYMGKYVAFVQYMPNKPIKHGIKVYALCCSRAGVLYNFKVYTGRGGSTVGTPKDIID